MSGDGVILCVLAGGRSSRFRASNASGPSKLNIRVGDEPVLAWLAQRLRPALTMELQRQRLIHGGIDAVPPVRAQRADRSGQHPRATAPPFPRVHLWLNLAPGLAPPPGACCFERWVVDSQAYAGPLVGMRTVLAEASRVSPASRVVFVGVDAPAISTSLVARLLRVSAQQPQAVTIMGQRIGPDHQRRVEPLPSVWRSQAGVDLIDRAMRQNVRGPSRLAGRAGVVLESIHALERPGCVNINEARDMIDASRVLGRNVSVAGG